jgi:hypothetical protein
MLKIDVPDTIFDFSIIQSKGEIRTMARPYGNIFIRPVVFARLRTIMHKNI